MHRRLDEYQEKIDKISDQIIEIYDEVIRNYLKTLFPKVDSWDYFGCYFYGYFSLDFKLRESLGIMNDRYQIYGLENGYVHNLLVERYEFEEKLKEAGLGSWM